MMRLACFGALCSILGGCEGPWTYDLELSTPTDILTIGEPAEVVIDGALDLPRGRAVEISLSMLSLETTPAPEWEATMDFTGTSADPSSFVFLTEATSGDLSPVARLEAAVDRPQEVDVRWAFTCGTPGEFSLWGEVDYEAADGSSRDAESASPTLAVLCE